MPIDTLHPKSAPPRLSPCVLYGKRVADDNGMRLDIAEALKAGVLLNELEDRLDWEENHG